MKGNSNRSFKFNARRDTSFGCFLFVACAIVVFLAIVLPVLSSKPFGGAGFLISCLVAVMTTGLFLWIWIDTYYLINNGTLTAKSGPVSWKIPIKEVSMIRLNQKTIGGTWKPTLSWNCIEIIYKK